MSDPQHDDPIIETMRQAMAGYLKNKIQQQELRNYAGQNLMYNHAANTANQLGLSPEQKLGIQPYPASHNTSINIGDPNKDDEIQSLRTQLDELMKAQEAASKPEPVEIGPEPEPAVVQPVTEKKKRNWLPVAAGVGGATIAGLGTALAMTLANPKPTPPPEPPPVVKQDEEPIVANPLDPNVGLQVEGIPE